jgi:two-component system response regulator HydG
MRLKSLKSKLLVAVSALVMGSGLLISLLVTQRYSGSLLETMVGQAENIAYEVALEAADKGLINDPVGLQKMLDRHLRSHRAVAYFLVSRNDQVLAHTFTKGIPAGLLNAKVVTSGGQFRFQKIAATSGERYLDIAWPIFEGKGGVLRLGFLEKPIRKRVANLWIQMSALTLTVLLIALAGALIFVRRITEPLGELAKATQKIDEGDLGVRVKERGQDEVGKLAASFNHMVGRMEEYTRKLEEQTVEVERAHDQTRTFSGIVREIGTQSRLNDVCSYLLKRFQGIVACRHMVLLVFGLNGDHHFLLSEKEAKILQGDDHETAFTALRGLEGMTFMSKDTFHSPLIPDDFQSAERLVIFPFHHANQMLGALFVACPEECQCTTEGLEMVDLILDQTSGAINRAALQEQQVRDLQARLESTAEYGGIVGKGPNMQVVFKLIEDIAPTDTSVLIEGESGTGKELVAHAIHRKSLRKDKPFVVINCSAYPATLLESELFGHEKGAFTGAIRQKSGRFEQADGGTVFLDEIGEISPTAQIKLLRVLQSHKFERVGGEQTVTVDVRILAATNKDLTAQ